MAEPTWPQAVLEDRRTLWILTILSLFLFAIGNLPWQLDDYDQAKQAFTSFQMVQEGRWLYQTTPHERIATKPPLVGWISAGIFSVTRSWELAWRLPSLLSAVTIAFLLVRFSKSAFGIAPAILTFAAFSFNLMTPRLATLVRTDMPLALVIFIIGVLIWTKLRTHDSWRPNDRLIIFVLLTAGMLIKGPVVSAFLLPGIIVFQFWRGNGAPSAFPGVWPWVGSLIIFLIWVWGGVRLTPGFYDQVVVREFLGRFGGEVHRAQPLFFYLPHLLHKFAPWSLLMIALGLVQLRRAHWKWRNIKISPETSWLVCWSLGGLLMMSLLPSKRVDRIFPVVPPLCLLLGAQLADGFCIAAMKSRLYRWSAAAAGFAVLFTSSYVGWKIITDYRQHRDALVNFGSDVRKLAAAHQWRYAVMNSPDEGLLLYLRLPRFVRRENAVSDWNNNRIQALVVAAPEASDLLGELPEAAPILVESTAQNGAAYTLLARRNETH